MAVTAGGISGVIQATDGLGSRIAGIAAVAAVGVMVIYRVATAGIVLADDRVTLRWILWNTTVPVAEIASFNVERPAVESSWWNAVEVNLVTRLGLRVRVYTHPITSNGQDPPRAWDLVRSLNGWLQEIRGASGGNG